MVVPKSKVNTLSLNLDSLISELSLKEIQQFQTLSSLFLKGCGNDAQFLSPLSDADRDVLKIISSLYVCSYW